MNHLFQPERDPFLEFLASAGGVGLVVTSLLAMIVLGLFLRKQSPEGFDVPAAKQWMIAVSVLAALVLSSSLVSIHIADKQQQAHQVSQLTTFLAVNHADKDFSKKEAELWQRKAVEDQNSEVMYRLIWVATSSNEGYVLVKDDPSFDR